MTVVTGQLRPGGAPYDGSLRLDVELDGVRLAYVDGGQIYTRRRPVDVDADGNFAVDLLPNDQIDPPGTVWMFTILPVSGFGRPDRFRVSVEDSDEPVDAHEILVPEPELLPSAAPAYQRTSERGVTYAALDELGRVLDAAGIPVGTDLAAVEAHAALTEGVHGIADTGALVLTTDDRLSDERSPTSHAASHGAAGEDPITVDASQLAGTIPVERLPADVIFQVSELLGLIAALQASWRTDDAALKDEVLEGLAGLSETIAALQALADDDTDVGTLLDAIGLKQNQAANLDALALLDGTGGDKFPYLTGAGSMAAAAITLRARNFLAALTQADMRSILGLGSAATQATGNFQPHHSRLDTLVSFASTAIGRAILGAADEAAVVNLLTTPLRAVHLVYVGTSAAPVTDPATARPATSGPVYWLCADGVTPTAAVAGDLVATLDP